MTNPILRALVTGILNALAVGVMLAGFYFGLTRGPDFGTWALSGVLPLSYAQLLGMILIMFGGLLLGAIVLELAPSRPRRGRKKAPRRRS